jgi:hypothetical protein
MVHEVARVAQAAQGLVVKQVNTVEVRIIAAVLLGAAADDLLFATTSQKLVPV